MIYTVIKETPGYQIDSYSDIEVIERFDSPMDALKLQDKLRENAGECESYYVTVSLGSLDNV